MPTASGPIASAVVPILFVRDVDRAAAFYRDTLGFSVDFLYGAPIFYGSVSLGLARLHLRHVDRPNFAELAAVEPFLILASIEVGDVTALFDSFATEGSDMPQTLTHQPWGGTDFHVRDPDGNVISFVQYD